MDVRIERAGEARLLKIDDNEYFFSNPYKDMVSNSRLGLIDPATGGSIQAFLKGFSEKGYTSPFEIGGAVHGVVLQPERYRIADIDAPSPKLYDACGLYLAGGLYNPESFFASLKDSGYNKGRVTREGAARLYDSCKDYLAHKMKYGSRDNTLLYLNKGDRKIAEECIRAVKGNPVMRELLLDGEEYEGRSVYNEYAIVCPFRIRVGNAEKEITLKCKVDRFVEYEGHIEVIDLKTTGHRSSEFENSFERFHYYRQAAFYKLMLDALYEGKKPVKSFVFACVSTFDCSTGLYKVKKKDYEKGQEELSRLLGLAALAFMDWDYRRDFQKFSIRSIAVGFSGKIKMISLLCLLLQQFRKKDPNYTVRSLIQRLRKDSTCQVSEDMLDRLEIMVEEFYYPDEKYPPFGCKNAVEMKAFINKVLDKELPFSAGEGYDDLPF